MRSKKLLLLVSLLLVLTACQGPKTTQDANNTVKENKQVEANLPPKEDLPSLLALKGPTAMGMAYLLTGDSAWKDKAQIATNPDQALTATAKGEAQIAALPSNMAAILYNKSGKNIQVQGINVTNVLYLVSKEGTLQSLDDLKGREVVLSGKGATPEFVLKALLKKAGLGEDDVKLTFKTQHEEVLQALMEGSDQVALLPQPFLSAAQLKSDALSNPLDLGALWKEYFDTDLVTGVLVVDKTWAKDNQDTLKAFLAAYEDSVNKVKDNPQDASKRIEELGIVKAPVAEMAIPASGLTLIQGDEMKEALETYYKALYGEEEKSLGGPLPGPDFYGQVQ